MASRAVFQGSKRAGRIAALNDKTVRIEQRKLRKVRLLALRLSSIYELDAYLTRAYPTDADSDKKEAVRKLILTFRPDLRRT